MRLPNNNKLNFLVGVHFNFKDVLTGGIVAMHKLAYNLAVRGHNVFTFCEPEYPHENITVINSWISGEDENGKILQWENFSFPLSNTISIYNEITRENPFNTQHVARWLLYHTEKTVEDTWGENDVYFNFGDFKTYRKKDSRKLTVLNYYFEKLYIENYVTRNGFCHMFHKNTPSDAVEMVSKFSSKNLGDWKTKGAWDYLRKEFNKYEYFLTYDQKSFYTLAAILCGCKAIILRNDVIDEKNKNAFVESEDYSYNLTPTEYRLKNPIQMFGVAYGLEDIGWANKTIQFSTNHLKELEIIDQKTIDNFVNFWIDKVKID
jgi:hypothetical protein